MDWINDKLYCLNSCGNHIEVLDLASHDRMILVRDIYPQLYQSNIVVDPTTRSVYTTCTCTEFFYNCMCSITIAITTVSM